MSYADKILKQWSTPQMMASDERLIEILETLAKKYESGIRENFSVDEIRRIIAERNEIQAELWRRGL
jgi:hypothetical protein